MNPPPRKLRKPSPRSASASTSTSSRDYHHHQYHEDRDREQDTNSVLTSEFGALSRLSSFEIIPSPRSQRHPHHPEAGSPVSHTHAHRQRQRLERLQQISVASLAVSPISPHSTVSSPFQFSPASTISPIGLIPSIPSVPSMHWLFRSNIPRRNKSIIAPSDPSNKGKKDKKAKSLKRSLFGIGMASRSSSSVGLSEPPHHASRSLAETKNLLAEARRDLRQLEAQVQAREAQESGEVRRIEHSRSKSKSSSSHNHHRSEKSSVTLKTATLKAMPNDLYFHRVREEEVLRRMLDPEGVVGFGGHQPTGRGGCQWIVVGGAEGCGKTALLHQILASPQGFSATTTSYVTLHLDLRFSPFGAGDMEGLYMSLNSLMVGFWEEVAELSEVEGMGEGWELFTSVAQGFKNDRNAVERRILPSNSTLTPSSTSLQPGHDFRSEKRALPRSQSTSGSKAVKTSDIARLMEMFQCGLVKYWDFEPQTSGRHSSRAKHASHDVNGGSEVTSSSRTKVEGEPEPNSNPTEEGKIGRSGSRRWGFMAFGSTGRMRGGGGSRRDRRSRASREVRGSEETTVEREKGKEREEIPDEGQSGRWLGKKKVPVIFIDEAHKLSHLIPSDTLKCLLDSLLVLTKQNRLCHVIHASSDPFYQSWLRSTGVLSGCKMITLGDLNKHETRRFYRERVFPRVPERIRGPLNFEVLWDAFGGRMVHWMDYMEEFVGSGGVMDVKQSSHFLQAHTLLNLHIIHASQAPGSNDPNPDQGGAGANNGNTSMNHPNMSNTDTRTLHPGLGPAGFKAYAGYGGGGDTSFGSGFGFSGTTVGFPNLTPLPSPAPPPFTAMQLLKVISRLSLATTGLSSDGMTTVINPGGEPYLAYFHLCRELGVRTVDGMVRGGVLDLRWNECIGAGMPMGLLPPSNPPLGLHTRDSTMVGPGPMPIPMQMPSTLTAPPVSTQTSQSRQQMPPAYLTTPDRGRRPGSPLYADSAHAPSPAAVAALSVAAGVADMDDEDDYDMVPVDVNVDEEEEDDEVLMDRRVNPAAIPLPPSVAPSIMLQSTAHLPLPTPAPPPPLPQSDQQTTPYQPYQLPASLPSQPQYRDSDYYTHGTNPNEDSMEGEVVGPKLLPITPIMRYAMREVVQEYEDDQSVSEYASLSDVDEY